MKRRDFMKYVLAGGITTPSLAQCAFPMVRNNEGNEAAQTSGKRPNIIVIMADDMGFSDLGCYGGEIDTPNIDRLAAEGMRFSQFYNCAVCGPSRSSLLSGLYHHQVGVRNWTGKLPNNCTTIAELLHEDGYTTMMVGRMDFITVGNWYEPKVAERYLDHFFGSNGHTGPGNYFKAIRGVQILLYGKEYQIPEEGFYSTDAMNDYAVKFLEEAVCKDKPFFLYAAPSAPHWPLHAKPEDIAKYREKYRKQGWDKLREHRRQRLVEMGLVDERRLDEAYCYYEIKRSPEHYHLVCKACSRVIDFESRLISELIDEVQRNSDFDIVRATLYLEGYCPECKSKGKTR